MFYSSVQLINFRNYQKQNLKLHEGVNVFVGENGQGKTNLLESLHFLTKGKSFRPGKNQHFILNESKHSSLQGVLCDGQMKSLVKVQFKEEKKEVYLNEKKTNGAKLSKMAPCVLFSPESLSAIKDGPEQRRELIDEWVLTYSLQNFQKLSTFKKCLSQRNKILKSIKLDQIEHQEGQRLLQAIQPMFVKAGAELAQARIDALETIQPLLSNAMKEISGESLGDVDISVDYQISGESQRDSDIERIAKVLEKRLAELAPAELKSGHSLVGPHKHDITFLFNGEDSRYWCSQGQQRALILSFKMAQIVYHYRVYQSYPILLLDDVLSELDKGKQTNLVRFLNKVNSQILITTTEFDFESEFGAKPLAVYRVRAGGIETKS